MHRYFNVFVIRCRIENRRYESTKFEVATKMKIHRVNEMAICIFFPSLPLTLSSGFEHTVSSITVYCVWWSLCKTGARTHRGKYFSKLKNVENRILNSTCTPQLNSNSRSSHIALSYTPSSHAINLHLFNVVISIFPFFRYKYLVRRVIVLVASTAVVLVLPILFLLLQAANLQQWDKFKLPKMFVN